MKIIFEFYEPERLYFIELNDFYINQSKQRLLSQFNNLESEFNQKYEEFYEESGKHFDPDIHDSFTFVDASHDAALSYYFMLSSMKTQTYLSILAGMFHNFDKTLRAWIEKELRFRFLLGEKFRAQLWKVDITKIYDLFKVLGWNVRTENFYEDLDACKLIVNFYKHGKGSALTQIINKYPQYLSNKDFSINYTYDDSLVVLNEKDLEKFSNAISNFWRTVPDILKNDNVALPQWFIDAFNADVK